MIVEVNINGLTYEVGAESTHEGAVKALQHHQQSDAQLPDEATLFIVAKKAAQRVRLTPETGNV